MIMTISLIHLYLHSAQILILPMRHHIYSDPNSFQYAYMHKDTIAASAMNEHHVPVTYIEEKSCNELLSNAITIELPSIVRDILTSGDKVIIHRRGLFQELVEKCTPMK